jgi:ectoine hydroxylase-related dioxygenase (phytanoyl-CoA dioxygenase family)
MTTAVEQNNSTHEPAPPGFTPEQWAIFERDGIIFLEDALSSDEIQRYTDAIERVASADPKFRTDETFARQNVVEKDSVLAELIDHPRHVGFAHDIFGEQLKLHISQFFIRPPGMTNYNLWHPDGARALPYGVFSPRLPLQIKIGYWLTGLPEAKMGNLVVLPGSHLQQYVDQYDTRDSAPGELIVKVKAGTITVMHSSIWHRVEPNESDVVRKNIFYAYCPAWVTAGDRLKSDPEWIRTLSREQRIIMRSYDQGYDHAKPPASEFPLFLDRDTGSDRDEGAYSDHVALHRRKRRTKAEEWVAAAG